MEPFEQAFLSPKFLQDPYPWYEELRQRAPLAFHEDWGSWFAVNYADINAILRDRRFVRSMPPGESKRVAPPDLFQELGDHMLMDMEPPDHTRLKGMVMGIFTPRRVEGLRDRVQRLAGMLVQEGIAQGPFDLLHAVAEPLSVTVIADLLGIPESIRPMLRPWSKAIVAMYELRTTAVERIAANQAVEEFFAALNELLDLRRDQPGDDLVSGLAAAEARGEIRRVEALSTAVLLLNAGHEATVNASGNGMLALLRTPGAWPALQADAGLLRGVMEEMLRYDTPLQLFNRWAAEDVIYNGITIRKNQRVSLLYGAANRDPARFPHPAQFDPWRAENPHLTFGTGIHYCLGAPLARLEMSAILSSLREHCRALEIETVQPRFFDSFVIRGLTELRLRCTS